MKPNVWDKPPDSSLGSAVCKFLVQLFAGCKRRDSQGAKSLLKKLVDHNSFTNSSALLMPFFKASRSPMHKTRACVAASGPQRCGASSGSLTPQQVRHLAGRQTFSDPISGGQIAATHARFVHRDRLAFEKWHEESGRVGETVVVTSFLKQGFGTWSLCAGNRRTIERGICRLPNKGMNPGGLSHVRLHRSAGVLARFFITRLERWVPSGVLLVLV